MKFPTWLVVAAGIAVLLVLASTQLAVVAYVILGVAVLAQIMRISTTTSPA